MARSASRCSRAAAYVIAHGCTYTMAAERFGISADAIRAARYRIDGAPRVRVRMRRERMPALSLAVLLAASGETCRRAAMVYGLSPEQVLAAWNRRNPRARRSFT